jgi:hypothetical protein
VNSSDLMMLAAGVAAVAVVIAPVAAVAALAWLARWVWRRVRGW